MKMSRGVAFLFFFFHEQNTWNKHTEGSRTYRLTSENFKFEQTLHAMTRLADSVRLMHARALFVYADVPIPIPAVPDLSSLSYRSLGHFSKRGCFPPVLRVIVRAWS